MTRVVVLTNLNKLQSICVTCNIILIQKFGYPLICLKLDNVCLELVLPLGVLKYFFKDSKLQRLELKRNH